MSGNHEPLDDDAIDEAADHVTQHSRYHSDEADSDEPVMSSDEIFRKPGPP